MTEAIAMHEVSLAYRMPTHSASSLKDLVVNSWRRQVTFTQHTALRNISLSVPAGHVLGVVGANGAGKSTLMKVIARVLPPSSGHLIVRGRVAALIELGAGFNPELTGFENVVLYGTLLGRSPSTMREAAPSILEWAGLTDFANVPLRAYSSGMSARLAFSIAVDADPDILLVDEVLSVGDAEFRSKSGDRLRHLINRGAAAVVISHDMEQVRAHCSEVIWLEKGAVVERGDPELVTSQYEAAVHEAKGMGTDH